MGSWRARARLRSPAPDPQMAGKRELEEPSYFAKRDPFELYPFWFSTLADDDSSLGIDAALSMDHSAFASLNHYQSYKGTLLSFE